MYFQVSKVLGAHQTTSMKSTEALALKLLGEKFLSFAYQRKALNVALRTYDSRDVAWFTSLL